MKSLLGLKARAQTAVSSACLTWTLSTCARSTTARSAATQYQDLNPLCGLALDQHTACRCRSSLIESLPKTEPSPALDCSLPKSSPKTFMRVGLRRLALLCVSCCCTMKQRHGLLFFTGTLDSRVASSDSGRCAAFVHPYSLELQYLSALMDLANLLLWCCSGICKGSSCSASSLCG